MVSKKELRAAFKRSEKQNLDLLLAYNKLYQQIVPLDKQINDRTMELDRKISRVQRLVAQLRFPECIVIWERNLLVVKEENLHADPTEILKAFVNYITIQEITIVAEGDWKIIVV